MAPSPHCCPEESREARGPEAPLPGRLAGRTPHAASSARRPLWPVALEQTLVFGLNARTKPGRPADTGHLWGQPDSSPPSPERGQQQSPGAAEPEWDSGLHGDTAGEEVGQCRASSPEDWLRGSRRGWGSVHGTSAGWGQTTPEGLGVQGSQQKARDGRPELGACKPALGPRGSPSCGPGAPLAASQPLSALWSRLCVSGLPIREDEREGLYVAVGMRNQGLHITT